MQRFHQIFFLFFLLCLPGAAQANPGDNAPVNKKTPLKTYTLKTAVNHALDANPGVEAKLLAVEQAKMGVGVAQSYFWPTVSLTVGQNRLKNSGDTSSSDDYSQRSYTKGLRASMSLFAGFAHLNNVQKSLLSVDMENARHRQARLELIANVQLQFLQLLKARDDLRTVYASKKRILTQLKAAKAFVDVGMAPYLNVLQNEVELSKINQNEIRVVNTIRTTEVQLNKFLAYDTNMYIAYKGSLKDFSGVIGYTEEQAINTALFSRPDLIIAQKSVAVAIKQSHISAGRYLPSVNATYDEMRYKRDYDADEYEDYSRKYWALNLNVSWDIFDGGNTTFTFLGDRKHVASLRKEYEDTMSSARTEVIRSLLDIQAAKELITASRKGVDAASESYAMANKRYITHTGTITDLLDAQSKLTQSEADYSQALMEYHGARARFFYNIGRENIGLE